MAVFAVFEHPDKSPDRTVFVREGFSAAALVFTVLWALWHRMWIVSAILIAAYGLTNTLGMSEPVVALLELAVSLVFGFEARNLWAQSLRRAGYREAALIMASNHEEAELKFAFASRARGNQSFPVSRLQMQAPDTLGLFGNV